MHVLCLLANESSDETGVCLLHCGSSVVEYADALRLLSRREWLQGLWQWLSARRTDLPLLLSTGWPLLPVQDNQLVPLQLLASSPVVAAGGDSWPDGLAAVLQKLGCFVLDTAGFELPLEALLQHCVHRPSGAGVAAAICAALGWGGYAAAGQELSMQQQLAGQAASERLTVDDARILRAFLLHQRWFSGAAAAGAAGDVGQRALLLVAQQLPLYELANKSLMRQASDDEQQRQEVGRHATVALSAGCCLAPAGERVQWNSRWQYSSVQHRGY
jgi:hypothetical protein